jgi:hypothetical protein
MVYNSEAPQTFWVNNQDELITSDTDAGQEHTVRQSIYMDD